MSEADKEQQQKEIDSEIKNSEKSDQSSPKSRGEVLNQQISEGKETYNSASSSIFLSSLTAGLEIGFSYLLLASLTSFLMGKVDQETIYRAMALVYPVGFILVILGQSILFTEQTSLLTLPVLNKKKSLSSLLKLWGVVILGNLMGGCIVAVILTWVGERLHLFSEPTVMLIANHVIAASPMAILVSAILAGWLMGLLSWLLTSSKETISRIILIFIVTSVMAFTSLHHSIIGNVEVFSGFIAGSSITLQEYLSFEGLALLGNALGGAVFVALLKYRAFVYNVGNS